MGELLFLQKEGVAEYSLLFLMPERWREVTVPFVKLRDAFWAAARTACRRYHGKIYACAAGGAFMGVLLCALLYRAPEGYIVPRFYTDAQAETSVFLESGEDPDYEGYRIMNYKDAETPMQVVSGKAVKLETARYYVGSAVARRFFRSGVCDTVAYGKPAEKGGCGGYRNFRV